jgi:hypothetical protein
MHISLRARLDTARDRFVVEFEPGTGEKRLPIPVEGLSKPVELVLDADGYILAVEIPDLAVGLANLAGKPEGGKPGKPHR